MSEIHPTGEYPALVKDHGFSTARSGTRQLWVKFETEHGKITAYLALTAAAIEYTTKKVRAMGFMEDDFELLDDGEKLKGRECVVTVSHEEYEGRVRPKVGWVYPPGGGSTQRDAKAAKDARRFNDALKREPKIGEVPAGEAPATGGAELEISDGEIPF